MPLVPVSGEVIGGSATTATVGCATAGAATLLVTHDHEEAFAIADDLVVMREGRVVQSGPIGEVWRHPADAWVARFLGYSTVLTGAAARTLIEALPADVARDWQAVALRRSALQAVAEGSDELSGIVVATRAATDVLRLVVDVPILGVVPAVAPSGSAWVVGDHARLVPLPDRMAGLRDGL